MQADDFDRMKNQINRIMGEFFKDIKPLGYQYERSFHPPMDIYETEEELVIVLEIAGMKSEDFHVAIEKDFLSIRGTRTETCSSPKTHLHQMEIDYGDFERTLRLPLPIRADNIKAIYRQGFLIITLSKAREMISRTVEVSLR